MDESFEIEAMDGSFHEEEAEEEAVFYQCNQCPYKTKYKHNLKRHKHGKHAIGEAPGTTTSSAENVSAICDQCGSVFKTMYGLRSHVRSKHENNFKYTCDACGRGFQGLWNFRGHLRSHNDALKESCSVCSKKFTYTTSRIAHERTHEKTIAKKTSVCSPCNTEFKEEKHLKEHNRGRHGGKEYVCVICQKVYRWRSSLAYHMKYFKH